MKSLILQAPLTDAQCFEVITPVWDVVVVGGGMVGAALALGLAKQDFRVLLLEKNVPDLSWNPSLGYQTRVSALTRASENILKNLNAWDGIVERRAHAFTAMHVWDEVSAGEVHFSAADLHEPNLGFVVENSVVQAALWEQLLKQKNLQILTGVEVSQLSTDDLQASLEVLGVGVLTTRLLVGADGANSIVRQKANIGLETHDYEQCAVVGCVKTEYSHQDTCWQRYQKDGPFAFLAMDDNVSSIAWYLPLDKMTWALSMDDKSFALELNKASANRLGDIIEVAERAAFPLVRRHAEHYVKPHLALVGDAAHTIHPQAGQGVNLGLLDVAALIETLCEARANSAIKDWSRLSVLRRYERWRRGDNIIVQRSMEGFGWLFKQDTQLKVGVRNLLLPLANRLTPIKNWLMNQALNGREAAPQLAKEIIRVRGHL